MARESLSFLEKLVLPIPPGKQGVHFFAFIWVFKQLENTVIKSLWIGDEIRTIEDIRRRQGKPCLLWGFSFRQGLTAYRYHLCRSICKWSTSNAGHPVNSRISWPRGFCFFLHRTGRGEDMFESLQVQSSELNRISEVRHMTLISNEPRNSPFQGSLSSYSCDAYKNIGHWSPETVSSPVASFRLTLH